MKKIFSLLLIIYCMYAWLHVSFDVKASGNTDTIDIQTSDTQETGQKDIPVTELDLGEFSDVMIVGEKQLLAVTVLPLDSTESNIIYASSNTSVATIGGLGRITAVSAGVTTITASCGGKSASFTLTVEEKKSDHIAVTELDMGDYQSKMETGSTQLLSVTVLPLNATENTITYVSSAPKTASVNSMGRISALAVGKATITASCGGKSVSFSLKVIEKKDDKIPVTDIEIAEHEDELAVDKTLTLTATVIPSDATDSKVTFRSSNETIATVNSSGEVKGISKGKVTIYASAGKITKKIPLNIKVETAAININNTYLVMKPKDTYKLNANVTPSEANQSITYRSVDEEIAIVNQNGAVTAHSLGSTTIIVSNGDTSAAVSVIVNQSNEHINDTQQKNENKEVIKEFSDTIEASTVSVVDRDTLNYLYTNKKSLNIVGEGYQIEIDGNDIVNYENELYTDIQLSKDNEGTRFVINKKEYICGEITLLLDNPEGKYLYLYNDAKKKYESVGATDIKRLLITIPGEYLITDKKINGNADIIRYIFIAGGVLVLVGAGVYIFLKKGYWFW